ncbi:MAG: flagellin [Ruminococcus sp.]|nr:flagellin [Ruminococcus sp.]
MRIQHNIAALNSYRNLTGNNNAVGKNLEKLSSGYRINRAGDDAAGLAISEKMRAQITGLETAQKNANDGISLVQTAEGALTEVHSMLNRMVELADQSANGTYDNDTDRANLQKEVASLNSEINRISAGTNFNGIKLLDGSLNNGSTAKLQFGATTINASAGSDFTGTIQIDTDETAAAGITVNIADNGTTLQITLGSLAESSYSSSQINQAVKDAVAAKLAGSTVTNEAAVSALSSFDASFTGKLTLKAGEDTLDTGAVAATADPTKAGLTLQIGDTADTFNQLTVKIGAMDATSLGIGGIDIATQAGAKDAIDLIKTAINTVSSTRGDLGAAQNRLEHTINNLSVTTENMTAAESRIRDVDMAKEMMAYTKNNILVQASQAMLAQANQIPQGVLQLLQ